MKLLNSIKEVRDLVSQWKKEGFKIALIPTMGFLHEGHESLMQKAKKENHKVVVSIFVNPIQFGPNEDFHSYPRDIEKDSKTCEKNGVDLVFNPNTKDMYTNHNLTFVNVEELGDGLCGGKRPGHFKGVCTVVSKLFNIVTPDTAYFGEKDAQQLIILRKMIEDLNFNIELIACPIIREADGLARSSRNIYLSPEKRQAALILNKSLNKAKNYLKEGLVETSKIKNIIKDVINSEPLARIDYIEIVDSYTLKNVDIIQGEVLIAIAVFIDTTRLIDNFFWKTT